MENNSKQIILADERAAAFKAVYLNQVDTRNFTAKFPAVAKTKKAVFSLVTGELPKGLTGPALDRACCALAGAKLPARCWSDDEMRDALVDYHFKAADGVKVDAILARYGVSRTRLFEHHKRLRAAAKLAKLDESEAGKTDWRRVAAALEFPTGGRPTLFSPDEERLLLEMAALHADHGAGKSVRQRLVYCKRAATAIAAAEPEGPAKQRLANASLGRGWLAVATVRQGGADEWKESKPSLLARSRAMAEKPEQNATMFKNLQEMVNASGKKGELPGCGPDANGNYEAPGHLWYAGDEMGVEPNGKKWTRVLTRRDTGSDKVHRIVTGEHSPFWVTLLFFSRSTAPSPSRRASSTRPRRCAATSRTACPSCRARPGSFARPSRGTSRPTTGSSCAPT
mmetsp:Transcript_54637/g.162419  ORF Transcript_54637/g.162419 Transcript_54637/m.162419 type:complete len:397 (+) Transcript_54637:126-1316(+)